ncbi:MAG: hypothetical protein AAF081_02800 [Actinomycetota bacterium]
MATVSEFLRTETRDRHAATEQAMARAADLTTDAGWNTYFGVMYAVTAEHADALDDAAMLADVPPRSERLLVALERDAAAAADLEPVVASSAEAIAGIAYTLEGSALGAEVLRRRLPVGRRSAYLDLLIDGRADRWRAIRRWLDTMPASSMPVMLRWADETFGRTLALCESGAHRR